MVKYGVQILNFSIGDISDERVAIGNEEFELIEEFRHAKVDEIVSKRIKILCNNLNFGISTGL